MTKYNAMSDGELSAEVLKTKIPSRKHDEIEIKGSRAVVQEGFGWIYFDINNPADAWPIIVENKIFTRYDDVVTNQWMAGLNHQNIVGLSDNPFRAAAVVYLMMMEGE